MSPTPFPHLAPLEAFLWARFLSRYGAQWDTFDYDVRLGQGVPPDPDLLPVYQDMATRLSLKRADAVGWLGGQPTIFEVTPRGSRTTWGALDLYRFLFLEKYPQSPAPHLAAVVNRCDADCTRFFEAKGVQLFVIPETPPTP